MRVAVIFWIVVALLIGLAIWIGTLATGPSELRPTFTTVDDRPGGLSLLPDFTARLHEKSRVMLVQSLAQIDSFEQTAEGLRPRKNHGLGDNTVRVPNQVEHRTGAPRQKVRRQATTLIYVQRSFYLKGSLDTVLSLAAGGGRVVVCASSFDFDFLDSLNVWLTGLTDESEDSPAWIRLVSDTSTKYPTNSAFPLAPTFFVAEDTTQVLALATDSQGRPVAIRVTYGRGEFILMCHPEYFTNAGIADSVRGRFTQRIVSMIPAETIYIHAEQMKKDNSFTAASGLLDYIFQFPSLRYAYYTLLVAVALFLLFRSKRRQSYIPRRAVLENTSATFIDHMAWTGYRRYQPSRSFDASIIDARAAYLFDFVKRVYGIELRSGSDGVYADFQRRSALDSNTIHTLRARLDQTLRGEPMDAVGAFEFAELLEKVYMAGYPEPHPPGQHPLN